MVKLIGTLGRIKKINALVIGDFMLDTYTTGVVSRISPEAPVPVLHVKSEESLPGGAGNVALNLVSLGAGASAIGRVGTDMAGIELTSLLEEAKADVSGLLIQKDYQTPVKNRLLADAQQLARIDSETKTSIDKKTEQEILQAVQSKSPQIIAISDYHKGLMTPKLLNEVISYGKKKKIPVIVDPKGDDFSKYRGATLIKPNLLEAYRAAKLPQEASLEEVAEELFIQTDVEMLLITKSQEGMSLFLRDGSVHHFPVKLKEVIDVTGAGDTVLAVITLALANKLDLEDAAQLANVAAGIAIERIGCARVTLSDLAERLLELNSVNKIYEANHLFALEQVLKEKEFTVLGLDEMQEMSSVLFSTIRELSKNEKLVVYVTKTNEEFLSLLSSLHEIDFILLKSESLSHICEKIHPTHVYTLHDEELKAFDHPTQLLSHLSEVSLATT